MVEGGGANRVTRRRVPVTPGLHDGVMERSHEFSEVSVERLEQLLVDGAARMNAAMARWLALVDEYDRREAWLGWEARSCAQWLSWQCGVGLATARDQIRVARALRELPLTRAAFAAGDLSYSKVRALARIALPETEAGLVELARAMAASQLEKVSGRVDRIRREADDSAARRAFEARYHEVSYDDDGSLVGRYRIPADQAAAFKAVIDERSRELAAADRAVAAEVADAPVRTATQRRADALAELVASGGVASAETPAPAVEVVVETTAETIADDGTGGWLVDGRPVSPLVAQLVGCDAAVQAVIRGRNGEVLDLGRRQRLPSAAQKRALRQRDRQCTVPGCVADARHQLHAHHVARWGRDGGRTDLGNLVLVCTFHHRHIHMGLLDVEVVAGCPVYKAGDRRLLEPIDVERPVDLEDLLADLEAHGHVAGGTPGGPSERMDITYTVDSICDGITVARSRRRKAQSVSAETPMEAMAG